MSADDLELLGAFRADVPLPDEGSAARIYQTVMLRSRRRAPGLGAPRGIRPKAALAVGLVVLAVLAPASFAAVKLAGLFEGTPAPPAVSGRFTMHNRMADRAAQRAFAARFPRADVSNAHGVVEVQTADGPEDLWVAPNDQGGESALIDFANDTPGPNGVQYGVGISYTATAPPTNIGWTIDWDIQHPALLTVIGRVYVDAATVQAALADGETATFPVVEGFFLGSLDQDAKVTGVTAYDSAGNTIAHADRGA